MAKASEVNTSGVSSGLKKMAALASEAQLEIALIAGSTIILNLAKELTPKKTTNLARSERIGDFKYNNGSASIRVGTNVEYGPYVELGTIHQTAQPYLRPAFDQGKPEALRKVSASLKKQLGKQIG